MNKFSIYKEEFDKNYVGKSSLYCFLPVHAIFETIRTP